MANLNVEANITGPDKIEVRLVREDYLGVSNTFRILFEICFAVACTVFGNMISFTEIKKIPFLYWFILVFMIIISIVVAWLAAINYKKAKSLS